MIAAGDGFEAVLFDIDGTICEYEREVDEMLEVAFDAAGVEPFFDPNDYRRRFDDFTDEAETIADLRERCFGAIAREYDRDPGLGREVARAYADERDHGNVRFIDGAQVALEQLSRSTPLAAVTNGSPEMQTPKLAALEVDCFETVVHAGYETPAKPDPKPFEVALECLGVAAEDSLYVGNDIQADVRGAHNAGMAAAWISNGGAVPAEYRPEYVLDTPRELLSIVE